METKKKQETLMKQFQISSSSPNLVSPADVAKE